MQPLFSFYKQLRCFLLLVTILPFVLPAQDYKPVKSAVFGRRYKAGETSHYSLTTEEIQNGKWALTTTVICEMKVVYDSAGIPYEEIHWLSKKKATTKDTTDETKDALSVKPYRIS